MAVLLVGALMLAQGFVDGSGDQITEVPEVEAVGAEVAAEVTPEPTPAPFLVRAVWDRLAQCESTSNWHANTGNGYTGGLQFDAPTWRRYGGLEYAPAAYLASREAQVIIAERTLAVQGWSAWPVCSRRLGLR